MVSEGDDAEDVPEVQELQMERREVARRFLRAVAGRIWFKTESEMAKCLDRILMRDRTGQWVTFECRMPKGHKGEHLSSDISEHVKLGAKGVEGAFVRISWSREPD